MGCAHGKSQDAYSPSGIDEYPRGYQSHQHHQPIQNQQLQHQQQQQKIPVSPVIIKEFRKTASPKLPVRLADKGTPKLEALDADDTFRPSPVSRPLSGLLNAPQSPYSSDLDMADLPRFSKVSNTFLPTSGSKVVSVPDYGYELRYSFLTQRGYYPEALDKANQDSYCVHTPFGQDANDHFFGVFDGHGEFGTHCSQFARKQLCDNLLRNRHFKTNALKAYHQAFIGTNLQLHRHHIDDSMSGTTGITVLVRGRTLYVANVGDSRAVVAERRGRTLQAVDLSNDQTPFRGDECARVRLCGARVLTLDQLEGLKNPDVQCWGGEEDDDGDPPRLWVAAGMYPGTAFTRSIGDTVAEQIGVIAVPEVLIMELTAQHPFFVIASDGVFEFLSSQAVVDMVAKHADPQDACAAIVAESYRLWLQNETRTDDITIIVVFVDHLRPPTSSSDGDEDLDQEAEGTLQQQEQGADGKSEEQEALVVKGKTLDTLVLGDPNGSAGRGAGGEGVVSPLKVEQGGANHILLDGVEDLRGSRKQFFTDLGGSLLEHSREAQESGELSPLCLNSAENSPSPAVTGADFARRAESGDRQSAPSSESQQAGA
ncbi:protein MpPP2C_E [Marchantia polymorpha subsp. ruderalis]|nr:hypothetical protein MARPO_0116s0039 [Marchantia polymorpha]BBN09518.1 hypothetical protein Mp_4g20380 [Marchantia polymorpha subsp. ruderalis]|eukprot:PTQ31053.1 hypothetical protein MARPO_0116s0039 [Marchantia polymorpha]